MFAVGHLSLGYLFAKGSAKLLKTEVNIPLVFVLSLLPDVDILIPGVAHRTITHSLILALVLSLPFFMLYKTKAIPYFAALAQHSLVGDLLTGGTRGEGIQIFWPLTSNHYGLPISVFSTTNIILEWSAFLVAIAIMLKTKDLQKLLRGQMSHLSLSVPALTVLLPPFLSFPIASPTELILPHVAYLTLFALSLLNVFRSIVKRSD